MRRFENENTKILNNNKLKMRESQENMFHTFGRDNHNKNLDRLYMERDFTLNAKTKKFINSDNDSIGSNMYDDEKSIGKGEITGNKYDKTVDTDNRGLPMRSQYNIRKPVYDENEHLDFNLFDEKPSKLKVKSFDPLSGNSNSGFAEIKTSMKNISSQLNPVTICSNTIEKLTNELFYTLYDLMNKNYIINGLGLYELFASLYLSSGGMTEVELKKYFDFPEKEVLYKGLSKIYLGLTDIEHMINIKNFMIIDNDVPHDVEYINIIKYFCTLIAININNCEKEAIKINTLVNNIMRCEMRKIVTSENLNDLQLMFLTVATIHPVWKYPFDKITTEYFNKTKINYLHGINRTYGYFEDNENQLIEILCENNLMSMGILLSRGENISDIDETKMHFYITHMKECVMDEVLIPMFQVDTKIRYNSVLKQTGLKSPFIKVVSPKLFPENVILHDIIQNVKIIINNDNCGTKSENKNVYKTSRRFIVNKKFIYYFRLIATNTIILIGIYT